MTFITNVFPKLQTVKNMVRLMFGQPLFRAPIGNEYVKPSQTVIISGWQHVYHTFCSLLARYIWKKSLLGMFQPLGLFVKTLTADDMYSLRNSENFREPIQMELSKILKIFCQHFAELVQSTSNFKHFGKKTIVSLRMYFRSYPL